MPVPPGLKGPVERGWQKRIPGPDDLTAMFSGNGNIGVMLGEPSRWIVDVDLDCPEAVELADRFLPFTPVVTGRPGNPASHRWYRAKGAATRQFRDQVNNEMIVELRSTGGQTLVGPSVHPDSGEIYDLFQGEPAEVDAEHLLGCVQAIARAVIKLRYPEGVKADESEALPDTPQSTHTSAGHAFTSDPIIVERARRYLTKVPPGISGCGGHDRTYAAATCMVHGFGLEPTLAFDLLKREFNPRCEPPWSDSELWHKVDHAATKPHRHPFRWLADASLNSTGLRSTMANAPSEAELPALRDCTELANAELFAELYKDAVKFCPERKAWLNWTGKQWSGGFPGAALNKAGEMVKRLRTEPQLMRGIAPEISFNWPKKCETHMKLNALVKLAAAQPALLVSVKDLDPDPWLFNAANGTIDLRTGTLREHRSSDFITQCSPVPFRPDAACPRFRRFLDEVFGGDQALIDYVIRFLAHCLTGDTREEYLHIFHGDGNNGKSVLIDTLLHIFDDYGNLAPPTLLTQKRRSEHPTELAELRGKRLVVASETEKGESLKIEQIKRLTGDEHIKGRGMHENFVTFPRRCKMILSTNNMVQVPENTEAVRRRLRVVPFDVIIPEDQRDNTLREALRHEAPGILALLVQGCLEWQRKGLRTMPAAMISATAAHGWVKDDFQEFIDTYFERSVPDRRGESACVPWAVIRERYLEWTGAKGQDPMSEHALQRALSHMGYTPTTRRVGEATEKVRVGLRLKARRAA